MKVIEVIFIEDGIRVLRKIVMRVDPGPTLLRKRVSLHQSLKLCGNVNSCHENKSTVKNTCAFCG